MKRTSKSSNLLTQENTLTVNFEPVQEHGLGKKKRDKSKRNRIQRKVFENMNVKITIWFQRRKKTLTSIYTSAVKRVEEKRHQQSKENQEKKKFKATNKLENSNNPGEYSKVKQTAPSTPKSGQKRAAKDYASSPMERKADGRGMDDSHTPSSPPRDAIIQTPNDPPAAPRKQPVHKKLKQYTGDLLNTAKIKLSFDGFDSNKQKSIDESNENQT